MDLKTQLKTVAKNHQTSIQNFKTKFDRLADKQFGRPSGSLPSNTQPNPKGHNSKAYQPPQARNEHVNVVFTRNGKSYNPPDNPNDQQKETPINFDSDDEDDEPTPQPKTQNLKPAKETPLPKPYKPKIPYPQPGMPNYGNFLKELISNKHKIEQISAAFLSDESSAMIKNKVPPKLGDPGSILIPCNFNRTFSSERSFQYPVGIAENMLDEVGKFTFPTDFVILEMEEVASIDVIDEILEEDFNALLDEGSKILHSIEGSLPEEEIFAKFDEFMAMTADENSDSESHTEEPTFEKITINTNYKIKTSLEEPPMNLELKPILDNMEYVFLKEPSFLLVIISSQLSKEKKNKHVFLFVTLIASSSSKSSSTKDDVLEGGGVSLNVTLSDSSTFLVCLLRMV
nr:hypothetical protein [Tanacetum cinerariifolium]